MLLLSAMMTGLLMGGQPARAEDDLGTISKISEWGPYRYKVYQYPSRTTSFFFYPKSYVTFDVRNGKYWMIESVRFDYQPMDNVGWGRLFSLGYRYRTPENLRVYFYTPDMKVLGEVEDPRCNRVYSIPRDGNDYERIVVKIESHSAWNWDLKMLVWDPVDPVIAEPIPTNTYR
ncbi:MAG: hypothetical protein AB1758_21505, partial [Candidatus Eremiobacterota bacterium]